MNKWAELFGCCLTAEYLLVVRSGKVELRGIGLELTGGFSEVGAGGNLSFGIASEIAAHMGDSAVCVPRANGS